MAQRCKDRTCQLPLDKGSYSAGSYGLGEHTLPHVASTPSQGIFVDIFRSYGFRPIGATINVDGWCGYIETGVPLTVQHAAYGSGTSHREMLSGSIYKRRTEGNGWPDSPVSR
ncbi:hypothetical protein M404DRAFT_998385 [Pisolithus tinctorius Marx 270]|uniref:Uncharacterized protein n=1 Tax=Pisolithus tinctorius Marx 270 TaxID=870435 RepID=A0A0C3P1L1_PISTI|nr:hypothetical protein M404DRAFT_998385 [Pisolithus tinctorius Marx 270]